jgi:hypothetical protein
MTRSCRERKNKVCAPAIRRLQQPRAHDIEQLSEKKDLREAATNLFRYLRQADQYGLDLIVAERVPPQGLGAAILDRLQRAAHA